MIVCIFVPLSFAWWKHSKSPATFSIKNESHSLKTCQVFFSLFQDIAKLFSIIAEHGNTCPQDQPFDLLSLMRASNS